MKTSKESAIEWLNRITSGDIVKDLTGWIEQDRAEQREACADDAREKLQEYLDAESFLDLDVLDAVIRACINAGVEE